MQLGIESWMQDKIIKQYQATCLTGGGEYTYNSCNNMRLTSILMIMALGSLLATMQTMPAHAQTRQGSSLADQQLTIPFRMPFSVGEQLSYDIKIFGITVGHGTLYIKGYGQVRGKKVYHIIARLESASFFNKIYAVDDYFETFVTTDDFKPLLFKMNIKESKAKKNRTIVIYQDKLMAEVIGRRTFDIGEHAQDALSSLYYLRCLHYKPPQDFFINALTDKRKHKVKVSTERTESIEVDAGTFDSILYVPVIDWKGHVYKDKLNRLSVWISNDERRLPVLMSTRLFFGTIRAELTRFQIGEPDHKE